MLLALILACSETEKETVADPPANTDTDTNACDGDQIEDCNDECSPSAWLGDGECDDAFNCPEFNQDENDCDTLDSGETGDTWDSGDTDETDETDETASCDDAIDIGSAGSFTSENMTLRWGYSSQFDDVVAGPYYFNFPSDLEGVSFTLDFGTSYAQPYYFRSENGSQEIINRNDSVNLVRNDWDNTNTVVLPMSPETSPPAGCVEVLFWGFDENDNSISEGATSTLHINSRRFSSGDSYVLNFVVVNGSSVSESELGSIWGTTSSLFDSMGIDISQTYFDTVETGEGGYIYANSAEANEIISTPPTNQGDTRELNVYFVDALLEDDGSMGLFGYAGGVPGPIGVLNTKNSGVIVSLDIHRFGDGTFDYTEFGATIAHELGHQLGLFHTTEQDGSENDILSDTPACGPSDDADSDGVLDPTECPDGDHVMFWTTPGGAFVQDAWSTQQTNVLLSSPMIFE